RDDRQQGRGRRRDPAPVATPGTAPPAWREPDRRPAGKVRRESPAPSRPTTVAAIRPRPGTRRGRTVDERGTRAGAARPARRPRVGTPRGHAHPCPTRLSPPVRAPRRFGPRRRHLPRPGPGGGRTHRVPDDDPASRPAGLIWTAPVGLVRDLVRILARSMVPLIWAVWFPARGRAPRPTRAEP